MSISLDRRQLADSLSHTPIDRDLLDLHPALAGLGLDRGLEPHDGLIDTERERDRMLSALDGLDGRRDGSITLIDDRGAITAAADPVRALAEAAGDARLRAQVIDAMRTARLDPRVVHLGMQNDSASREVAALRRESPVLAIGDVRDLDVVMVGDTTFPLEDRAAVAAFVATLGLSPGASRSVTEAIVATERAGRREVAELARALAPGERGEPIPPRLVLSGHGNGDELFGHGDDAIRDEVVVALARAMPRAAAQIQHLHLAACQHGWEPRMDGFRAAFPRLESAWGYTGFSPSGAPAIAQQRAWERATHDGDASDLRRESVAGSRRASEVAIWTRERGFEGLRGRELAVIADELDAALPLVDACARGDRPIRGSTDPELVRAYGLVQEAMNNPDFDEQSPAYQAHLVERRDQILRLRFYESDVAPRFAEAHAREIAHGYEAAGLAVPDFAHLSRGEAMRAIDALAAVRSRDPHARAALELLERGLRQLDRELVPTRWL